MISFPNNLPAFICTEIISYEKPFILKAADYFLTSLRIHTSYEQSSINDEGLPRGEYKATVAKRVRYGLFKGLIMFPFLTGILGKIVPPAYLSELFITTSLTINAAKNLNTYAWNKIDAKGGFLGCKLLKGLALVISASLPIFVGSLGLLGLYFKFGSSLPVISLIAFGCLVLQLSAGALLKVIAYNTNPKIKSAYDNYCKKVVHNTPIKLSKPENEIPYSSNIIEQSFEKIENKKALGLLNDLNADVMKLILSSYLPVQDLIQFRSVNKKLSEVFSNRTICIHRIQESFSTDFINKLGLEHILNAMENEPLNPLLVPIPYDANIPPNQGLEPITRTLNRIFAFDKYMENRQIAWGHETSQTQKNNSKLFLIFNDLNKGLLVFRDGVDKYYMISSHNNSEIAWEQSSIKKIFGNESIVAGLVTKPIYKVDNVHYSEVPIYELKDEDYNDETIIIKTDFFKRFNNPETLAHI